jgi:acetamidase/formamidase
MKLSVYERLILLNILPIEGDIITIRIMRQLRETLSFTEEEYRDLQFKNIHICPECETKAEGPGECLKCQSRLVFTGEIKWAEEADRPKEFTFGDVSSRIISERLQELSQQKKLKESHINLYEKFVEGKTE